MESASILQPGGGHGDHEDHIHPAPEGFIRKYIFSLDHKVIGIQYFVTGILLMLIAGAFAELVRIQLMDPAGTFMSRNAYNTMYTMHGTAR